MTERPILFSAPMVRAILAGTKTQTRRVLKPQPTHFNPAGVPRRVVPAGGPSDVVSCPYGAPGGKLWVREAYRLCSEADAIKPRDTDAAFRIWYEADAPHQPGAGKLRPGIHMPRWACRITLEAVSVRVERLQDISADDAKAEGISEFIGGWWCVEEAGPQQAGSTPQEGYRHLWERINGPGSWDANPWVWCVGFRRDG